VYYDRVPTVYYDRVPTVYYDRVPTVYYDRVPTLYFDKFPQCIMTRIPTVYYDRVPTVYYDRVPTVYYDRVHYTFPPCLFVQHNIYIPVMSDDLTLFAMILLLHMTSTYMNYYTTLQLYSIPQEERKHHTDP
jgi:hypothetical protein